MNKIEFYLMFHKLVKCLGIFQIYIISNPGIHPKKDS